jgi:hypothetical protein
MLEKIFLTALLFLLVSWTYISKTEADDVHDLVKIIILGTWVASGATSFVCALIKIWA